MKSLKIIGALLLAGTLVTTTYSPTAEGTTAQAKTTNTTITQVVGFKGANLYTTFDQAAAGKVKNQLSSNSYLQILDQLTINGEAFYRVSYGDFSEVTNLSSYIMDYKTPTRYIKVSDTKKVKHVYSPIVNKHAPHGGAYADTKRWKVTKSTPASTVARFDRPAENFYYQKNMYGFKLGERTIDGVPYTILYSVIGESGAYVKTSLLAPDNATNVKKYTKQQQKVTYKTVKATALRYSYGIDTPTFQLGDILKKGQTLRVYKEATYKGKKYVYVKLTNAEKDRYYDKGWVLKKRITK